MADTNAGDEPSQTGPGEKPTGVTGIILVAIYMFAIGAISCVVLCAKWPSCGNVAPLADADEIPSPVEDKADGGPPLRISSIEPDSGTASGGEFVTILGNGFTEKDLVIFGGKPVKPYFKGSGMLVVESPPHGPGKVNIVVTSSRGATPAGTFTYVCPGPEPRALILMVIFAGALGGTIHGFRSLTAYVGHRTFKESWILYYLSLPVSGALIALIFFLVVRAGFYTPQGTDRDMLLVGLAALVGLFSPQSMEKLKQIAEAVLTRVSSDARRSAAPSLMAVEPAGGRVNYEAPVVLRGRGFAGAKTVWFGTIAVPHFEVKSDSEITAITPNMAAGKVKVTVVLANNSKVELADGYTCEDLALARIEPNQGNAANPAPVKMEGQGFYGPIASVSFGTRSATSVRIRSSSELAAVPPPGTSGQQVDVAVTLADGQSARIAGGYTYN
jgi:hypothetical protein